MANNLSLASLLFYDILPHSKLDLWVLLGEEDRGVEVVHPPLLEDHEVWFRIRDIMHNLLS